MDTIGYMYQQTNILKKPRDWIQVVNVPTLTSLAQLGPVWNPFFLRYCGYKPKTNISKNISSTERARIEEIRNTYIYNILNSSLSAYFE